ncbi:MAG: CRISPR-associated helicase Cas3' [Actinobacteria bacterium]|nr:CRISPR-associated helicase Cas3' [Actinomycetota bacterium]
MNNSEQNYFHYWGKAEKNRQDYHLLVYHCLDVAAVGNVLLKRHEIMRKKFVDLTGFDESTCVRFLVLFLGLHDIGKFSESFQNLRQDLFQQLQGRASDRSYLVRHDSLGNLLWTDGIWDSCAIAFSELPDFKASSGYWQEIFSYTAKAHTGHHGEPPHTVGPNGLRLTLSKFFNRGEIDASKDFFLDFHNLLFHEHRAASSMQSPTSIYEFIPIASWLMAGFVVLCDWIGSNSEWFPFCENPMPLVDYWRKYATPQAERAVREASLDVVSPRKYENALKSLFPAISKPTPLQQHVAKCPIRGAPQLFILEDVTGSGKTEAALTLAQRLIASGAGNGIFIALPTMATSNAMYERIATMYNNFFTEESCPSLVLAHGARHLSESFLRSITSSYQIQDVNGNIDEAPGAQCTTWLADNRKKALLADVGIGTLDQALLAILPSRFQSLRLLGIAGHILIIDEVHAYDPYMNRLLQTLLTFHAALGGSAILLSATLPMKVRQGLISSFAQRLAMKDFGEVKCTDYPLSTYLSSDGIAEYPVEAFSQRKSKVNVKIVAEWDKLERLILETARKGRCICWIRNTVYDAVAAYKALRKKFEADTALDEKGVMLFHARFAMGDRLDIEKVVCGSFGKLSGEEQRSGKVLIATQVVEQSLDLDFDLIISDLAPMDLLIQRAGRLHRHLRDGKGNLLLPGTGSDRREPPCFIIHGPLPVDDADNDWYTRFFPRGAFVYPSHGRLWLCARLLQDKRVLRVPDDARSLIEDAYSDEAVDLIPAPLQQRDLTAEAQWQADRSLAHLNMLKLEEGYSATANQWLEDMRTPTRLGDMETTVRLARWDGKVLTPWYAKGDFPWDMSQINLRSVMVSAEADHDDPALKSAIEQLKTRLPDRSKWSVLVPLCINADGIWQGKVLNKKGEGVILSYDPVTGVSLTEGDD